MMRTEISVEAAKATPPITVAALGHVANWTLNDIVLTATLVYIGLQAAYLLWKWVREWRKG